LPNDAYLDNKHDQIDTNTINLDNHSLEVEDKGGFLPEVSQSESDSNYRMILRRSEDQIQSLTKQNEA